MKNLFLKFLSLITLLSFIGMIICLFRENIVLIDFIWNAFQFIVSIFLRYAITGSFFNISINFQGLLSLLSFNKNYDSYEQEDFIKHQNNVINNRNNH